MVARGGPPVRCVVFDVGGVLLELSGIDAMLQWMRNSTDVEGLWRAWLTSPAVREFERGRMDPWTFATQLVAEFDLVVGPDEFLKGFTAWPVGPLPGAKDLLRRVRPGIVRATLSNTNALHWPRVMNEMDFERHFDHHFASHLMDRIKPDHEAFEHVAETIGLDPGEILFVDDNRINVDAAREYGMQAHRCVGPEAVRAVLLDHALIAPA
jgi:HAD superfamily hydrolase (TIGR01509 family)